MNTQKCRVCDKEVGKYGWNMHVLKHKRDFCKVIGRVESDAWRINWEDVVKYYNPKEAKEKDCLNYEIIKKDKSLGDFK